MAGLDRTSFEFALKEHYTGDKVENLVYQDNPLLALMPKSTEGFGKYIPVPVIYGTGGRRSATFSQAQTRGGSVSTNGVSFQLTPISDYAVATVDGMLIATAKGNPNAFMESVTTEIDSTITELKNSLGRDIYRSGWGSIGVIASISTATITFATPSDVNHFEKGLQVVFSESESSDDLRNDGAGLIVDTIDRDAGTVTFTAALSTETGTLVGDYIFVKGDRQDSATPTRRKVAGLEAWLPADAPAASESFFNVDRSEDATRLAGLRYAPTAGTPINTILCNAATRVQVQEGRLSHFFMHPNKMNELVQSLDSKVHYVDMQVATVGFRAVEILTPAGTVKVLADRNCPENKVYGLDMSTWKIYSGGALVRPLDEDSVGSMLRQSTADGYEIRYGYYAQVGCKAPGRNIVITLAD